jgi:hypothetical protein
MRFWKHVKFIFHLFILLQSLPTRRLISVCLCCNCYFLMFCSLKVTVKQDSKMTSPVYVMLCAGLYRIWVLLFSFWFTSSCIKHVRVFRVCVILFLWECEDGMPEIRQTSINIYISHSIRIEYQV